MKGVWHFGKRRIESEVIQERKDLDLFSHKIREHYGQYLNYNDDRPDLTKSDAFDL